MKKHFFLLLLLGAVQAGNTQNRFPPAGSVGIGTPSPHPSSILDIHSQSRGVLIPRLNSAQRNAIHAPAQGLIVFQTNGAKGFYYYDGGWKSIGNDGANRNLSNLSTTAINRDLLPNKTNVRNIGSAILGFKDLYLEGHLFINRVRLITPSNDISNFFIGPFAGNASASGISNTALGHRALENLSNGFANTAVGDLALWATTNASNNTAVGHTALSSNTTGSENAAVGMQTLVQNTTGNLNTAMGSFALYSNSIGDGNTSMGVHAIMFNRTGHNNTAMGREALKNLKEGSENVAIGYESAASAGQLSGGTFIGAHIQTSENLENATGIGYGTVVTASNQVRIGNMWVGSIGGYSDWSNFSDGRYKQVVQQEVPGIAFISRLRPVLYTLNRAGLENTLRKSREQLSSLSISSQENDNTLYTGFIAQEVEGAAKELNYEFSGIDRPKNEGDLYGLRYGAFVVPLVKSVQELHASVVTLQDEIKQLKSELETLRIQSSSQVPNSAMGDNQLQQIVPNPAQNMTVIYYKLPAGSRNASLVLSNMKGQQIEQYILSPLSREIKVNTSALPAGTYTISLWVDGKLGDTKNISIIR